jgi:ribonuclease BN (tRNA processing enzyme)
MIDCGSGVLGNLQSQLDLREVSDIIITHMHADHFFDLIPYRYALRYGFNGPRQSMPKLYLPPGGKEILNRVVAPFAESEAFFAEVFNVSEFNPETPLLIGDLRVNFIAVHHYIPTYGLSITGSKKLAYSSDSSLCPAIRELASDADLLLCTVGRCLGAEIDYLWGHMLPDEAGRVAKEARAKRLMITHLWPDCDHVSSKQSASEAFGGEVELAEILQTYNI